MTVKTNMSHLKRFNNLLLSIAAISTLSACVNFTAKAPPALLILTASNSLAKDSVNAGDPANALVIQTPSVPRKLDTNRVPVQVDDSNIAYMKDAIWADKPAVLMQQLLAETIATKNKQLILDEAATNGKAVHFLNGTLLNFGINAQTNEAIVTYDALRMERGKIVEKRRFESRRPVLLVNAASSGPALNAAANEVAGQVADWMKAGPPAAGAK
jgi:cholesterol transport system auxiliary component